MYVCMCVCVSPLLLSSSFRCNVAVEVAVRVVSPRRCCYSPFHTVHVAGEKEEEEAPMGASACTARDVGRIRVTTQL